MGSGFARVVCRTAVAGRSWLCSSVVLGRWPCGTDLQGVWYGSPSVGAIIADLPAGGLADSIDLMVARRLTGRAAGSRRPQSRHTLAVMA